MRNGCFISAYAFEIINMLHNRTKIYKVKSNFFYYLRRALFTYEEVISQNQEKGTPTFMGHQPLSIHVKKGESRMILKKII